MDRPISFRTSMTGGRAMVHISGSYVAGLSESALAELAWVHLNAGYQKPLPYTRERSERVRNTTRPEVVVTYIPTRLAAKD
jgi:hypothetical protein